MLWIKAFHIIVVIAWMAGIFYLPRLFVYHSQADDKISRDRFKTMERKLYIGIMSPSAIATILSGIWLWFGYDFNGVWLHAKLGLVVLLIIYHLWCGQIISLFAREEITKGHVFFRIMNELPVLILIGIVILVVIKPF